MHDLSKSPMITHPLTETNSVVITYIFSHISNIIIIKMNKIYIEKTMRV